MATLVNNLPAQAGTVAVSLSAAVGSGGDVGGTLTIDSEDLIVISGAGTTNLVCDRGETPAAHYVGTSVSYSVSALNVCFLEANNPEASLGDVTFDKVYDRDGNETAGDLIPTAMGLSFGTVQGHTNGIVATETGLWELSSIVNPTSDATALLDIFLAEVGDYTGGVRLCPPTVDNTKIALLEFCMTDMVSLDAGQGFFLNITALNPTDPSYKAIGYSTLKIVRLA